jgi:hypothetical protein
VLLLRAEAEEKLGDRTGARGSLEEALREGEALPEALRPVGQMEKVRRRLQGLDGGT